MALEKCCLCCKLENGAFIWGMLSTVVHLIVFLIFLQVKSEIGLNHYKTPLGTAIIIDLAAAVSLAFGAAAKNHYAMMPWIVLNGILLIPLIPIAFVVLLCVSPIFFPFYIWWCICSAYQKVQEHDKPVMPMVNVISSNLLPGYSMPDLPPYQPMNQQQ